MMPALQRLLAALAEPDSTRPFNGARWSEVIAVARAGNLLGRLAVRMKGGGIAVPAGPGRHLDGLRALSERQSQSVHWEVSALQEALGGLGVPVLLLKGAAYVMAELPACSGRLFGDLDILVPRAALGDVELALMTHGWTSAKMAPYDQRYYRQWMHELPPMLHVRRGTVVDIHHTILPLTARHTPDPARILAQATPLADFPSLYIPCAEDLVIHSMTHLFHEGELHNGLRDLSDIDILLRHFSATRDGFWDSLRSRADELNLTWPLALGLHFTHRILATPVPETMLMESLRQFGSSAHQRFLEICYDRSLAPMHPDCDTRLTPLARWLLYVRGHWLRMPPHLLTLHLARKAWYRATGLDESPQRTPTNDVPQN